MKEIQAKDSIAKAIEEAKDSLSARIILESRLYEEKVFCEHPDIEICGAPDRSSIIVWRDGGRTLLSDGNIRGTFRSYTAFFGGERLTLRNLTIRNDAGDGRIAGQSIAAYLDSDVVYAENCSFISRQDTLFLSPLPEKERIPGGFRGPREHSPRRLTYQYFKNCYIAGDIDFIFGGADAVFEDCEIVCLDREHEPGFELFNEDSTIINSFITAPGGKKEDLGFVFINCRIRGQSGIRPESSYLGRPWRPEGKAAFMGCTIDSCINPKRFSGWDSVEAEESPDCFVEYNSKTPDGKPVCLSARNSWVNVPDEACAKGIIERAKKLKQHATSHNIK